MISFAGFFWSNGSIASNKSNRFGFKGLPVWAVIVLTLFLITSVSVSAAIVLDWKWNGIQLTIASPVEKSQTPESKISYKERIQKGLLENSKVWKKVTLLEAEKTLSYTLLRPNKDYVGMKQSDSFGIISQVLNYRVKSPNELWLGRVYDIYERDRQYAVVRQNLDGDKTRSLLNPDLTMRIAYLGSVEKIESSDRMLILYRKGDIENNLEISYKSEDKKVISLELTGSKGITKEDLLELAKVYTGS